MLTRSFDVGHINGVINHPDVRPFVGAPGLGELDMAPVIAMPQHWFLMGEHGGFLLEWSAPRVREWHTFVKPEGRGAWAVRLRKAAIEYAREHGARMLWTKIPPNAPHVERFARQGGMQPAGEVIETFGEPHRIYMMELG